MRLSVHGVRERAGGGVSTRTRIVWVQRASDACSSLIAKDPPRAVRTRSARIVGGLPANDRLAASLVFLVTPDSVDGRPVEAYCSGTLIGPRTVVTAAHCAVNGETLAVVGERVITSDVRAVYEVESWVRHPLHKGDGGDVVQYDIALVFLKLNVTDGVDYMPYNKDAALPPPDAYVRSVGYGVSADDGSDVGLLRQVDLVAQSDRECEVRHVRVNVELNSDRILCAGRTDRDGCGIW